jgi:peptide/nickel transport system substrate-binding protein
LAGGTAKILPAKLLGDNKFFKNPVGAGPFKIDSINKDSIDLTNHKDYHGEAPKIKSLNLKSLDQKVAMEKASKGKIHDLSSFPLSGMEEIFSKGQDISTIIADTWIVGFNSRIVPFDNLEIRKAFKASIDNEAFRKRFFPSAAKANGYIPQGLPGHIVNENRKIEVKVPEHSPITITIPKELDKAKEIAAFFTTDLKSKGWKINTQLIAWGEMMKRYEEKSLQSFLVAMNIDYPDTEFLLNNFASNNPDNFSGINDNIVDSLLEKARGIQDRLKRYEIYKDLAIRIEDLALTANLFHSRPHYWIHNCVRNFKPNLLAVAYIDYRNISFDQTCLREEESE